LLLNMATSKDREQLHTLIGLAASPWVLSTSLSFL
jgi:hypothetical protein